MPDLSTDTVTTWLHEREPAIAADAAGSGPPPEDHATVQPSVLRLGALLDAALARSPDRLKDRLREEQVQHHTRVALAQIGIGRRLRLLHWLTEIPGLEDVPTSLMAADTSDTGAFLRAEIRRLHRRTLLNRIFSQERIAALLAASTQAALSEAHA